MHLFEVHAEKMNGGSRTLLVAAEGAVEAYELVASDGTLVHEVARHGGWSVDGRTRVVARVEAHSTAAIGRRVSGETPAPRRWRRNRAFDG